jgi:hypothetical protein
VEFVFRLAGQEEEGGATDARPEVEDMDFTHPVSRGAERIPRRLVRSPRSCSRLSRG